MLDVVKGLIYRGALPGNAVSGNRNLYGPQGEKHLREFGSAQALDQASTREDCRTVLAPKESLELSPEARLLQGTAAGH